MRETNAIRRAKQRAKVLTQGSEDITHQQALDRIAVGKGHAHWAAMLAAEDASVGDMVVRAGVVDLLEHRWMAMSASVDDTIEMHFKSIATLLVGYNRKSWFSIRILFSTAAMVRTMSVGEAMDGSDLAQWTRERVGALRSEHGDRAAHAFRDELLASIDDLWRLGANYMMELGQAIEEHDDGEAILDDLLDVMTGEGVVPASIDTLGVASTAVLAAVCESRGFRQPLLPEERAMLAAACRRGYERQSGASRIIASVAWRSTGMSDAVSALPFEAGSVWQLSLAKLFEHDLRSFPESTGYMRCVGMPGPQVFERIRDIHEPDLFIEWLSDAVDKIGRDVRPFEFNPLKTDGEGRKAVVRRLFDLTGPVTDQRHELMVCGVIEGLIDLSIVGTRRGDLWQVVTDGSRVAGVNLDTLGRMVDFARSRGGSQILLYARIAGVGGEALETLRMLDQTGMLDSIDAVLSIARHPLMLDASSGR